MDRTLPEIYVMGVRNPYRISVNPRTSVLYWGEPGPDAGKDSIQGPKGYDEFNQAKKAGNYGWPFIVANNQAYSHWNFGTNTAGPLFNPAALVNNSPNNTGLQQLPPAQPAMIWYPYAASGQFPELGIGGRCAIGGPVYVFNKKTGSVNKFPEYYDGKLFIADWMRNWLMAVEFDSRENYVRTEPFMASNGDFRRPIDMKFSVDGTMYMLEYGSVYGVANKDASLVHIEYNTGNRVPIARAGIIDTAELSKINRRAFLTKDYKSQTLKKLVTGKAPLKVSFSGDGSIDADDDDEIKYQWLFDGKQIGARTKNAVYTYNTPGIYKAILRVTDRAGAVGRDTVTVKVGNTAPTVDITGTSNQSFYWKGKPFNYRVMVKDAEDKKIDPSRVKVFYTYNAQPLDNTSGNILKTLSAGEVSYPGKNIMAGSDCKSCHQLNAKAVGPSFFDVAKRYKSQTGAADKLAKKIIAGGGGNWGKDNVMSAHPQLNMNDSKEIVKYIFSLTDTKKVNKNIVAIPLRGQLDLKYNDAEPKGEYTIFATYTDQGGKVIGQLTGSKVITLRHAEMNAAFADEYAGFPRFRDKLSEGGDNAHLYFKNVDLTGIAGILYQYGSKDADGEIEIRLDSQAGPVISQVSYAKTGSFDKENNATGMINKPINGRHDIYIYVSKRTKPNTAIIRLNSIRFLPGE